MIIQNIKFLQKSMRFINHSQYLSNKISYNFSSPIIYNNLNLNAISEKWNAQFCYLTNSILQNQNKVRPNYGKCVRIRLVERTMQYVKGRPSYSIDMNCMDILKFAYWNHKYGKFILAVSNSYRQQVFTIQKIVQKYENTNHTKEQFTKLSQSSISNQNNKNKINNSSALQQQSTKELFKFSFYNNKVQQQKLKHFFMQPYELQFLQQILKAGYNQISFRQSIKDYQIYKQQKQINNNTKIIHSIYPNNHTNN